MSHNGNNVQSVIIIVRDEKKAITEKIVRYGNHAAMEACNTLIQKYLSPSEKLALMW